MSSANLKHRIRSLLHEDDGLTARTIWRMLPGNYSQKEVNSALKTLESNFEAFYLEAKEAEDEGFAPFTGPNRWYKMAPVSAVFET